MFANATEVKNNFGHYLECLEQEDVIVLRNGKPVARISRWSEFSQPVSALGLPLAEKSAEYSISGENDLSESDRSAGQIMGFPQFTRMNQETDKRMEYLDGQAFLLASPSAVHQRIVGHLHHHLYVWLTGKPCRVYLAPLDVIMGRNARDRNLVQPDLAIICDLDRFNKQGQYLGAPALIIEVVSPGSRSHDLVRKMDLYLRSGVSEYWVADPESRQIGQYQFSGQQIVWQKFYTDGEQISSKSFAGLSVPVTDIFAD
ncbi:MAG TPA: hypothetical protein DD640_02350 [Clostridiales bacterium]|nr:hypothetical protein [Clostridiales bacterium]